MFVLGDILVTVANILHIILVMYQWVVIAAVILSWVRPQPSNEIIRSLLIIVKRLTEPLFGFVRRKLPKSLMSTGLDFTPLIVLLVVYAVDMFSYRVLMHLGLRLSMGVTAVPPQDEIPVF